MHRSVENITCYYAVTLVWPVCLLSCTKKLCVFHLWNVWYCRKFS